MEAIKLSFDLWFVKLTTMCVDWFMNLFADPDYYWVGETYPPKSKKNVVSHGNNNAVHSVGKQSLASDPYYCTLEERKAQVDKALIVNKVDALFTNLSKMFPAIRVKPGYFTPINVSSVFQFVYIWDKLNDNVTKLIQRHSNIFAVGLR